MKRLLFIVALAAVYSLSFAQGDNKSKLSLTTKMFLRELDAGGFDPVKQEARRSMARKSGNIPVSKPRSKNEGRIYAAPDTIDGRAYVSAFIRLDDSNNTSAIEALGVEVQCRFQDGIVTANIPVDKIYEILDLDNVEDVSVARVMQPQTSASRGLTRTSDILSLSNQAKALGLNSAYTGKGVLLGIIDQGIDYRHIAFKDVEGKSRIKGAYVYKEKYPPVWFEDQIYVYTDCPTEDHGTHTASIAGGSSVIIDGESVTVTNNHANATFGGMAPESDLYLCGLHGYFDTYAANSMHLICNYADKHDMPVVVSNSWGDKWGNRNGQTNLSKIMSTYFKDVPNHICLFSSGNSAGNSKDGEGGGYHIKFTASRNNPLRTIIRQNTDVDCDAGYAYSNYIAYVSTRQPCTGGLCFKLKVVDCITGDVLFTSSEMTAGSGTIEGIDPYYVGELEYFCDNDCLYLWASDELHSNKFSITNGSSYERSNYTLAIELYPNEDSSVLDIWGWENVYFTNYLIDSWATGSDDMSVNNEAVMPEIISVGAYSGKNGDIANFSSYAIADQSPTNQDYPWITAPGVKIVSAVSSFNTEGKYLSGDQPQCVNKDVNNPYGVMSGTSMSTPMVAGIVALWMQAAKEKGIKLTTSQVKKIMKETASTDGIPNDSRKRFGNGKIDALAGISYILNYPSIESSRTSLTFYGEVDDTVEQSFHVRMANASEKFTVTALLHDPDDVFNIDKPIMVIGTEGVDVNVTWTPKAVGTSTATITLSTFNEDGMIGEVVVNLEGTVLAQPALSVNTNKLTFTSNPNTSSSRSLTVKGYRLREDAVLVLDDKAGVFSINKTDILAKDLDEPTTITVTFRPKSVGNYNGTLTIVSGDAQTSVISLYGSAGNTGVLSKYEYWFDDETPGKNYINLYGTEDEVDYDIKTESLLGGMHLLHTRVVQVGGEYPYSPVSTTLFFKRPEGTAKQVEYWFGDKYEGVTAVDLSAADGESEEVVIDMSNAKTFPTGQHRLNIRVATNGQAMGNVYTTSVIKKGNGSFDLLEYWVGKNGTRKTLKSKSSSDGVSIFDGDLKLGSLPIGLHQLNYRAVSSNGTAASTVYSTIIMKSGTGKIDKIEYWFNNNMSFKQEIPVTSTDEKGNAYFDGNMNLNSLPVGLHSVNYRAVSSTGNLSSNVYTQTVLKLGTSGTDKIEYWFGDKYENPQTIDCVAKDKDGNYMFDSSLDFGKLPMGAHRLNYRALSSDGSVISAIYTTTVFVRKGKTQTLEYWFDDDRGDNPPLEAKASGETFTFDKKLDLSQLSPGAHRLYYRAVSSDGTMAGAISSTSLIANSLYKSEDNPVKVTKYSVKIDEGTPMYYPVLSPAWQITQPYTLDARKMTDGEHQVSMKFWNSMGGGTSMNATFTKNAILPPSINLTAKEKNGLVSLSFNSVPNDVGYRICRVDGNNVKAVITGKYVSSYPANISFEDIPAEGSYTYYAESIYIDADGKQQRVSSNEVTVRVSKPQEEEMIAEQFGYVSGRIVCDQNTPTYGLKVAFSDGVTLSADNASFLRQKVPVGKKLTLTVTGDDTHEYELYELTVAAGVNYVTLRGTQIEGNQPDNLANDLCFGSDIEWTTVDGLSCARFKVQNLSRNKTWQGFVRVKAIDKTKADKKDYDLATLPYSNKNFYNHYSRDFEIGASADKMVTIIIDDLAKGKDTEYYLFFETVGKWKDIDMEKETKPVAINGSLGMTDNPVTKLIEKKVQIEDIWDEESMQKLANLIVRLSSLTDGLADKTGDLSRYRSDMVKIAQYLTGQTDESKAINDLMDLLDSKSLLEIINEPRLSSGFSHLFDVGSDLIGKMPEKYWNGLMRQIVNAADAKFLLSEFVQVVKGVTGKDELERAFACANLLYANIAYAASSSGAANPYSSLMYSYMVVGKALSNKVMELGKIIHDVWLSERLYLNRPFTGEQTGKNKDKYNTTCDFKIIVKSGKKKIDFTDVNMSRQVKRICIKASNNSTQGVAVIPFTCKFLSDGIMLVSLGKESIENASGITASLGAELTEFYMEIEWDNERTTKIPLIEETEGIDIHTGKRFEGLTGYEEDLDQSVYTITLTTASGKEHIGDELYLGTNKKRK